MKILYLILGFLGLGLGALGAALPLLPAFPFLMLAAVCFAKSSQRLNNWFLQTKLYKNNLESFVQGRGMTWRTKIRIMAIVTLTMAFGFAMMGRVPVGRVVLAAVWVFHILYFVFGIKTLPAGDNRGREIPIDFAGAEEDDAACGLLFLNPLCRRGRGARPGPSPLVCSHPVPPDPAGRNFPAPIVTKSSPAGERGLL